VARPKRTDLRSKLIDAAWDLFSSMGYDRATIESVIEKVGVSKGAFYHYFSNKEEVLDAVIDRIITQGLEELRLVVETQALSALGKLNSYISVSRRWRLANIGAVMAVAEVLYRDENIIIRHKIDKRIVALMKPLVSRILSQGVQEGVFDVADPEETAVLLLSMMNVMAEIQTRTLLERKQDPEVLSFLQRRANLNLEFVERILGAPKGSIERMSQGVFERISEAIHPDGEIRREESHGTPGSKSH